MMQKTAVFRSHGRARRGADHREWPLEKTRISRLNLIFTAGHEPGQISFDSNPALRCKPDDAKGKVLAWQSILGSLKIGGKYRRVKNLVAYENVSSKENRN